MNTAWLSRRLAKVTPYGWSSFRLSPIPDEDLELVIDVLGKMEQGISDANIERQLTAHQQQCFARAMAIITRDVEPDWSEAEGETGTLHGAQ